MTGIAPSSVGGKLRLTLLLILATAALNLGVSQWTASRLARRADDIRAAFEQQSIFWEVYGRVDAVRRDLRAVTVRGVPPSDSELAAIRQEGNAIHQRATDGVLHNPPEVAAAFHGIRAVTDSLFADWRRSFDASSAEEKAHWAKRSAVHADMLFGALIPRALDDAATRLNEARQAFSAAAASGSRLNWMVFLLSGLLSGVILLTLVGRLSPRLRRLERAASRLGSGDLDERVAVDSRDELGDVARAFNSMAERLSGTLVEHGKVEGKLRESESRFRQLFEYASDALYLHDLKGRHSDVNRQACEMLGYSRDELLATSVTEVAEGISQEELEAGWARMRPGEVRSVEVTHRRKDGTSIPVDIRVTMLELAGRKHVLAAARDLTERRHLEQQLLQASKLEAVGQLAGGIAHDFNNVLTAIRGQCQLALEDVDPSHSIYEELREIDRSASRAAELVLQLLAFSRRQVLQPRAVRPSETVQAMEPMLRRVINENILLEVTAEEEVGLVYVDPGQLEQVVLNLVLNAKDAMPSGGTVTIQLREERIDRLRRNGSSDPIEPGCYVLLTIEDDGEGIPDDVLPRIFEPFFTTKPVGKGSGLGLATVYGIVKQSGGSIDVRSGSLGGTRFDIRFPCVTDAPPDEVRPAEEPPRPAEGIRGRTILVVEDEGPVRNIIQRVLEREAFHVVMAVDGPDALRALSRSDGKVDLLITDVVMPGMGGAELAEQASSLRSGLPVLFMSGYTREDFRRGPAAGRYLEKPFTPDELVRKVRGMVQAPSV